MGGREGRESGREERGEWEGGGSRREGRGEWEGGREVNWCTTL